MKNKVLKSRRGVQAFLSVLLALGIGIVSVVVIAIMLNALQSSSSVTANSYAYNITGQGLTFLDNASKQLPTAGTIAGVTLLLAIIAMVGFGGYTAWKHSR